MDRYISPVESLEDSLKEMKLMREGKKKKRNWREMFDSIRNEMNVIKPKVENGKVLLDRDNPLHRYIMDEDD
jgi:hypothetical protein